MTLQLVEMSRLLDEALDLAPDALERWLEALPTEHRGLMSGPRSSPLMTHSDGMRARPDFLARFPTLTVPPARKRWRAGQRVGPYRLVCAIGRGGTSEVWRAETSAAGQPCGAAAIALKLPCAEGDDRHAHCLANEASLLEGLQHPSIVRLLEARLDTPEPYLALELVQGRPLGEWLCGNASDPCARLSVLAQLARAVAYLHERGIVHRDLKPANVLVAADGHARLVDFGIAARLATGGQDHWVRGSRSFTPGYAAPEQVGGARPAAAADLYALGVLLCEAVVAPSVVAAARQLARPMGVSGQSLRPERFAECLIQAASESAAGGGVARLARRLLNLDPTQRTLPAHALADALARRVRTARLRQPFQ